MPEARPHADESLDILRAVGDRRAYGKTLWALADINADLGDAETAAAQFEESLTLFVEFGDRWFGGIVVESAAYLAAETGGAERAVHLLAAADAIRTALEVPLWRRISRAARQCARRDAPRTGGSALRCGLGGRQADSPR